MNLIIGGAFQGKTDYALTHFSIPREAIVTCTEDSLPDLTRPCIRHLEAFALYCLRRGEEPREVLAACRADWQNTVFILNDISCGVVPMDAEDRAWREACGRMASYLAGEAERVIRIFCGLPLVLKGGQEHV